MIVFFDYYNIFLDLPWGSFLDILEFFDTLTQQSSAENIMTTIYIHGFGGSGNGVKANLFREYYTSINKPFIAPSLSYVPELAIATIEELIESYNSEVNLIGSSLGGYYSIYLSGKYDLKTVLINPSVYPFITLRKLLGPAMNFYDQSHFQWNDKHIEMLQKYETNTLKEQNFMTLLQKGDELLDYTQAAKKLSNSQLIVENGGNHSFDGIERYFKKIEQFFTDI